MENSVKSEEKNLIKYYGISLHPASHGKILPMKNSLTLTVPKPCSETWNNFIPAQNGGFCSSCSKIVVDFTKMSDDEILHFFTSKLTHTCGRFRADQLKSYSEIAPLKINPGLTLFKASLLSLLFLFLNKPSSAQSIPSQTKTEVIQHPNVRIEENTTNNSNQLIKGVIRSAEDNLPLPGVNVYLKGYAEGTSSIENGQFEFPKMLKEGDILVFSFIGFETKEYTVPKKVSAVIDISMNLSNEIMMGEIVVDGPYIPQKSNSSWWQKVKNIF